MGLTVVNQGEDQIMDLIVGVAMDLRLFVNDVTAGLTSDQIDALTESDFTEASFTGYSAVALTSGSWTVTAGNPTQAVTAAQTWTATAGFPVTVYGYYYTRNSDNTLIMFEQASSPGSLVASGDQVTMTPKITLDDKEGSDVVPGMIMPIGFDTAPTGWLLCDGSAVSRTTYAELFAAISTTFGVGDGSTTFNVPDMRQRMVLGTAASGTGSTTGGTGGSIDHTHNLNGSGAAALIYQDSGGNAYQRKVSGLTSYTRTDQHSITHASSSGTATVGTELAGASDTANPPYIACPFAIKT